MIKNGKVQGTTYTDPATVTAGLKWFKKNIEPNVLQFADIDVMRTKLQSGEIGVALSWNSYIRGILASDWNTRDQVAVPVYPASGSPGDRETLRVAKGTKHPVAARVLINWMIGPEFISAGWTQDRVRDRDQQVEPFEAGLPADLFRWHQCRGPGSSLRSGQSRTIRRTLRRSR